MQKNIKMISIIIPTFNEGANIRQLIKYLKEQQNNCSCEIIICDGGSTDKTIEIAMNSGAAAVISTSKGRSAQMNYGASIAKADILYFVHADSFPPASFFTDIENAVENGFEFGRYRTKFDSKKLILRLNAFFTRYDLFVCYGGDQTFFITKKIFNIIGGFKEDMQIMEDYEIITRAKAVAKYKIIKKDALVSARKYDTNSWLKVQRANYIIVQMYKKGASQNAMAEKYKQLLMYR